MDLFEAISTRKTIRDYEKFNPPKEDIEKIIDAARLAPSAVNAQNWEFLVITNNKILNEIAEIVAKKYDELSSIKELTEEEQKSILRYKKHSTFFRSAPILIVAIEKKRISANQKILERIGFQKEILDEMFPNSSRLSMGAAIENISLAAHALGYGSCWLCAPLLACFELKKFLNISKDDTIVSLISLGQAKNFELEKRVPKKSLEEIIKFIE